MAGKKTTAKSSSAANGMSNGHSPKAVAGSALTQSSKKKTEQGKAAGSRRAQPTADELGRLAWETTYKNRQKSRRA